MKKQEIHDKYGLIVIIMIVLFMTVTAVMGINSLDLIMLGVIVLIAVKIEKKRSNNE